ncbi:extracellular solute-binding protein [Ruania alba]|uniref:Carbohydrate ABC transporter substrate-binding protein, CUT1 family n=1 Tax=Ruania alba TaxID=648782 RepID=A0A1H5EL26_9MICO|nr:extracellular solute-binding protein [Ruania alba]SED91770.1 carbohydrate ABC transporter substrate-binding protein, CUT1 family [Ruania alba]
MTSSSRTSISRRTLLQTAAAGAGGLALAGCGSGTSSGSSGDSLSLMLFGPTEEFLTWLRETVLTPFTEEHGIDVEVRQSDWGSGFQKLLTATASGSLADVTMLGQVMTPALASKNAFLPIDEYLADWPEKDAIYPDMLADGTYDGVSYAVPVYADVRAPFYRTDLLDQVGASIPTTWDEYRAVAEALDAESGGPLEFPTFWSQDNAVGMMQAWSQLLYQAGGAFFSDDGASTLASAEGHAALEYLVGYFDSGLSDPHLVYQGTGARPTIAGTAGMVFGSQTQLRNAAEFAPEVRDHLVAGPPLGGTATSEPTTIAWINKLAISATTDQPDAAWALVSTLASKDNAERYAEFFGGLPARSDLTDAAYLEDSEPELIAALADARALPTSPNLLEIQQEINTALQAAIRQERSVEETLQQLDATIDGINAD